MLHAGFRGTILDGNAVEFRIRKNAKVRWEDMSTVPIPPTTLATGLTIQHLMARHRAITPTSAAASAVVSVASGWLLGGSLLQFRRQRTTFDPVHVAAVKSLVVQGPNRLTRNPMYVGMAGLLIAHAILRRSALAALPAAGFILVIDRAQIPVEESALSAKFGDDFEQYRSSVPRWLGRRSVTFFFGG